MDVIHDLSTIRQHKPMSDIFKDVLDLSSIFVTSDADVLGLGIRGALNVLLSLVKREKKVLVELVLIAH